MYLTGQASLSDRLRLLDAALLSQAGISDAPAVLAALGGQAGSPVLTALAGLNATPGILVQTGASSFTKRTITGTANEVTVTNGSGAAGNPTLSLSGSIDAAKAFRRGNVLGTVSQSSGAPTGALIERGSNANGQYVRLADGTQICTQQLTQSFGVTNASGALFVSSDIAGPSFPAVFAALDFVSIAVVGGNAARWIVCDINAPTTTNWQEYRIADTTSGTADSTLHFYAVGRWF